MSYLTLIQKVARNAFNLLETQGLLSQISYVASQTEPQYDAVSGDVVAPYDAPSTAFRALVDYDGTKRAYLGDINIIQQITTTEPVVYALTEDLPVTEPRTNDYLLVDSKKYSFLMFPDPTKTLYTFILEKL